MPCGLKKNKTQLVDVISVGGAETEPTLRKALAIGADAAIRVNAEAVDGHTVATYLAAPPQKKAVMTLSSQVENLLITMEVMVPGMLAAMLDANFVTNCISLEIEGANATAVREIDGGKETVSTVLPLVIGGQKGLVEESDLRIPNMRGIMMARKKPLTVVEPAANEASETHSVSFEKPAPRGAVKLVEADNIDELINLLHNEAKVI